MRYCGWVDLVEGGYFAVARVDDQGKVEMFNVAEKQWVKSDRSAYEMAYSTEWDNIDEQTALKAIREMTGDETLTL